MRYDPLVAVRRQMVKLHRMEIWQLSVDWFYLSQDRNKSWAVTYAVMGSVSIECGKFLD